MRCRPRSPPATPAAARPDDTDWRRIAALYDELARGHAVADRSSSTAPWPTPWHSARRPACASLEPLLEVPALSRYHLLPSVRGDFLHKLGRFDEARAEFRRAAEMTRNARERELLLKRAAGQG